MEEYITNNYLKIKNPQLKENTVLNYDGSIENFDIENIITSQLNNYFDIQKILNFENIYFTEINIVKWNSQVRCKYPSRCKFIIKTSNPYLLWYKYDTEAPGGGNNIIYYKDKKIKTTKFITFTENEFYDLLNI